MRHLLTILAALFLCAPAFGQTVKALSYGTNGRFITGTNALTFTNTINFAGGDVEILSGGMMRFAGTDRLELETGTLHGEWNFTEPDHVRGELGFSTNLNTLWTATNASNARSAAGLGATWLTNTNVTNFRSAIGLGATNSATFQAVTTEVMAVGAGTNSYFSADVNMVETALPIEFANNSAATTRTNLGLGATWLTNTNVTNFRTAIGLGINDTIHAYEFRADIAPSDAVSVQGSGIQFLGTAAAATRANLGVGATNIVTFAGITNNGDITINQTTATNGLLYIRRTNSEPFLGIANLIASNNTTVSNETLFRVGVAEATNRSAQFGFRSTNTNGNGVAVFSVFGFNALMQIGTDASTNAVIYSGGGTNNEVMTLIRDGATEFARPLRFSTNAASKPSTNAPANTTNVAAWVEMQIGTNSYRLPLYQ